LFSLNSDDELAAGLSKRLTSAGKDLFSVHPSQWTPAMIEKHILNPDQLGMFREFEGIYALYGWLQRWPLDDTLGQ
jgi:hypothetical protein